MQILFRAGWRHQYKLPVLDAARQMIVAAEKYAAPAQGLGDDMIGLTALGLTPGQSIMESVRGLMNKTNFDEEVFRQAALPTAGEPGKN